MASRYFALGVLCKQQGMYAEAATHYERILAIGLKVCAPRSIPMSLKHGDGALQAGQVRRGSHALCTTTSITSTCHRSALTTIIKHLHLRSPCTVPGRIKFLLKKLIKVADLQMLTTWVCKEHIKESFEELRCAPCIRI